MLCKSRLLPATLSYKHYLFNASPTQEVFSIFTQAKKKEIKNPANTEEYSDGK